jgi:hypothetical protein
LINIIMKLLLFLFAPAAIASAQEREKSFTHLKGRALVAEEASMSMPSMAGVVAHAYNALDDASSAAYVSGSKTGKGGVYGPKSGKRGKQCDEEDESPPSLKDVQGAVCDLKEEQFERDIYIGGNSCEDLIQKSLEYIVDDKDDFSGYQQGCRDLEKCWWLLGQDAVGYGGEGPGDLSTDVLGHYVAQPVCGWAEVYLGCDRALKISQLRELCFGLLAFTDLTR